MRWTTFLVLAALSAGPLACGEERGPVAPSGGPTEVAITPARESPDPPPAAPVMAEREPAAPSSGQAGDAGEVVPVSNADVVVASLRAKFRACYQTGLQDDPTMQGKVVVSAKVAPDGSVDKAAPGSVQGLSPRVALCIAETVKRAQFSPPGGKGATLQIPVSFIQKQ
jgi:hypothetical protein